MTSFRPLYRVIIYHLRACFTIPLPRHTSLDATRSADSAALHLTHSAGPFLSDTGPTSYRRTGVFYHRAGVPYRRTGVSYRCTGVSHRRTGVSHLTHGRLLPPHGRLLPPHGRLSPPRAGLLPPRGCLSQGARWHRIRWDQSIDCTAA